MPPGCAPRFLITHTHNMGVKPRAGPACVPSLHSSVAERSKALVYGTSLFGGMGSNPNDNLTFRYQCLICLTVTSAQILASGLGP